VIPLDPVALGLPHREPFIFIDAIIAHTPEKAATARKTFSGAEPMFRGHFPGDPIVPGVILTEALAQTAGIACSGRNAGAQPGGALRLSAIKSMKFLAAVRPGDEIQLHAQTAGALGTLWQCEVWAMVKDAKVAEGVIILSEATIA
jgi:3-hydroxyacyl-[acyl-carrier-protein] dehydratase